MVPRLDEEVSCLEKSGIKVMARNREAYHEYFVEEEFEAGIELVGTEVKSIRAGTLNLKDAWCGIKDGQLLLNQMHISPYDHGNRFNVDPRRPRCLLMHKREIMRLYGKVKQDGYSLIPLSVYFKGSRVKVNVGLCKGKKLYDKRQAAADRDAKRQIDRAMKERYKQWQILLLRLPWKTAVSSRANCTPRRLPRALRTSWSCARIITMTA